MNRERSVIRLFLASPSDLKNARLIVEQIVNEINRYISGYLGIILELVRWEDIIPGMGRPQQVILEQVDIEGIDIFVGILWNRFGMPTGIASSGTEEEFNIAYKLWMQHRRPRILFYFCDKPSNLKTIEEINQKLSVIKFRDKLDNLGIIRKFNQFRNFEILLRQDITKFLFEIQKSNEILTNRKFRGKTEKKGIKDISTDKDIYKGMVRIPAGEFLIGESPTFDVIDYDYYIDITPVTNQEFFNFVKETNYKISKMTDPIIFDRVKIFHEEALLKPNYPVAFVTWYDAIAYASWVGKRLPTSKEWEKAARGIDGRIYPWGNKFDYAKCNSKESEFRGTTPVFKYENGISPNGCYDMAGNVFEWVEDWAETPRFSSVQNSEKINRGGSNCRTFKHLVTYYCESDPPWKTFSDVGFRCAKDC